MYLASTGMVCSVGLSGEPACAAIRAGIAKFDELPYRINHGEPIIGSVVAGLALDLPYHERLVTLLSLAIEDSIRGMPSEPFFETPILVGLAESQRPGSHVAFESAILQRVQDRLGITFNRELSRVIAKGHTSAFEALNIARQLFAQTNTRACVICGVDSYIDASNLLWLEQHWRLKTLENSDGVIPGEAAAAILVCKHAQDNLSVAVQIIGLGFGFESAHVLDEKPLLGLGLVAAARCALYEARLQLHQVGFRLSDVTGESYGFKEQALMLAKLERTYREEFPIWHPAESIGDTGAAAGVCQLVIADDGMRKGYAPGHRAICYSSAVYGDRAVTVLQA